MELVNLIVEVSCASVLLFAGFFYITFKNKKTTGLNFIGLFLLILGIHYFSLLTSKLFDSPFDSFMDRIQLADFFLHSYPPLLYLATYHTLKNKKYLEKKKLWVFLLLLMPMFRLLIENNSDVELYWLSNLGCFGGSLLVTAFNLYKIRNTNSALVDKKLLIHINFSFFIMNVLWLFVLLSRINTASFEQYIITAFLLTQLYLIYGLIYYSLKNPSAISEEKVQIKYIEKEIKEPSEENKYKASNLTSFEIETIANSITSEIEDKELYLNSNLTIDELALEIDVSPRAISQVINTKYKTNFSDLVNDYRLKKALELLKKFDNKEMNISQVMYESGFSSKSNFYGYFKKKLSMTPKQYRTQSFMKKDEVNS